MVQITRPTLSSRSQALLAWSAAAIGVVSLCLHVWGWLNCVDGLPADIRYYVLAGLRLNLGHPLYGYAPGDVVVSVPGPNLTPLFSPPLLAVVFRAVVLLPANGAYIWWATMIALELAAVLTLVWRQPLVTGILLIPLGISASTAMSVGNVDCLIVAGLMVSYYWLAHGHDISAAVLISLLASLKLTPVVFVWWLMVTGRTRPAVVAFACGICLAVIATIATEPLIFLKFYSVTTANLAQPFTILSAVDVVRAVGAPETIVAWVPRAILVSGGALMWATRRQPGISWAIGAMLMWLGSPVAALHTPALALVAILPLAWRLPARFSPRGATRTVGEVVARTQA